MESGKPLFDSTYRLRAEQTDAPGAQKPATHHELDSEAGLVCDALDLSSRQIVSAHRLPLYHRVNAMNRPR